MEIFLDHSFRRSLFKQWKDYYAKYEPIICSSLELYANEILFRVNNYNNSHVSFLSELRARKETFLLFTKMVKNKYKFRSTRFIKSTFFIFFRWFIK